MKCLTYNATSQTAGLGRYLQAGRGAEPRLVTAPGLPAGTARLLGTSRGEGGEVAGWGLQAEGTGSEAQLQRCWGTDLQQTEWENCYTLLILVHISPCTKK